MAKKDNKKQHNFFLTHSVLLTHTRSKLDNIKHNRSEIRHANNKGNYRTDSWRKILLMVKIRAWKWFAKHRFL